jgi:DNA-binding PadR family transcriptional regulator
LLQRSDRDLPRLTVLALLLIKPQHTYEMHRLMVDTHKDFVTGLPRSMYHAVERLLRAELIEVVGTERQGGRPERTVYALTDAGRSELVAWVRRLLEHPDPDATLFVAALSFLGCLPAAQARAALDVRRAELDRQAGATRTALAEASHLPRLLLVEAEYDIARLSAERDWVTSLLVDFDAGRLAWPADLRDLEVPSVT